jgi:hypothetical protein
MTMLISSLIWGFASYKIAKTVKENEGLDVKPINYALLSVAFSFLFSMGVLFNKLGKFKNNTNVRIFSMIAIVFSIVLNIVMLF